MSVEAGISTGVGLSTGFASAGVSSGGFSSEMGSVPSFSVGTMESFSTPSFGMPVAETGGGSFTPNMTMESLFSDTTPFIVSEGRSFDRPIGNSDAIFSQKSDFSTIAENVKSPKEDAVSNLFKDTIPFVPALESFSERVSLRDAREILGDSINKSSGDLQEGKWASVAINQVPERELIDVNQPQKPPLEIKEEDMVQVKRVADVLISLGTEREDAQRQVLKIIREMNRKNEEVGQIALQSQDENKEEEAETSTDISGKAIAISAISEEEDQRSEEEDEEEKKKKKKQILKKKEEKAQEPVLEVDNSAQASRKSTFSQKISEAFQRAQEKRLDIVRGKDIVQGLEEKKEHKSMLLIQAGLDKAPDGSFQEVVDDLENLDVEDTSIAGEIYMRVKMHSIVDSKPAVKVSDASSSEPVTDEDGRRVTKFVNSTISPSY